MADFTIRSSQKDTSLFGWLKIRYTDEYNDELWKRISGDSDDDYICSINPWGITSLVRNSYRIVDTGLHCRSRFEEAHKWCKEHDVKKVRMCLDDIEYAIAVCRGVHNITDGSKEMRDVFSMTRKEKKRNFVDCVIDCGTLYAYKDARGNCWLRCWFSKKNQRYDECEAYMLEMATRFNISFDYIENPANGDRIFTFGRMAQ